MEFAPKSVLASMRQAAGNVAQTAEALLFDTPPAGNSNTSQQESARGANDSPRSTTASSPASIAGAGRKGSIAAMAPLPTPFLGLRLGTGAPGPAAGSDRAGSASRIPRSLSRMMSSAAPAVGQAAGGASAAGATHRRAGPAGASTTSDGGTPTKDATDRLDPSLSSPSDPSQGGDLASLASKLSKRCSALEKRVILLKTAVSAALDRLQEAGQVVEKSTGQELEAFLLPDQPNGGSANEDGPAGEGPSSTVPDLVRSELGSLGIGLARTVARGAVQAADSLASGLGLKGPSEPSGPTPPYIGHHIDVERLHRALLARAVSTAMARDREEGEAGTSQPIPSILSSLPSISGLEDEVARLTAAHVAGQAQVARLTAELASVRKEGHAGQAAKLAAAEDARRAASALASAQTQISSLQAEVAHHSAASETYRTEAESARRELATMAGELKAERERADEASAAVAGLTARIGELEHQLREVRITGPAPPGQGTANGGPGQAGAAMAEVQLVSLRTQHGQLERRHRELAAGHAALQEAYASLLSAQQAAQEQGTGHREPGTIKRRPRREGSATSLATAEEEGTARPSVESPMTTPVRADRVAGATVPHSAGPTGHGAASQPSSADLRLVPASEASSLSHQVMGLTASLASVRNDYEDVCTQLALARQQEAVLKGEVRVLASRLEAVSGLTVGPRGVAFAYLKNVVLQYVGFAGDPGAASQRRALALVLATLLDFDDRDRKRLGLPPGPVATATHGQGKTGQGSAASQGALTPQRGLASPPGPVAAAGAGVGIVSPVPVRAPAAEGGRPGHELVAVSVTPVSSKATTGGAMGASAPPTNTWSGIV